MSIIFLILAIAVGAAAFGDDSPKIYQKWCPKCGLLVAFTDKSMADKYAAKHVCGVAQ